MNKHIPATLLAMSLCLAACGDETANCSTPVVKNKLIDLAKGYIAKTANDHMNLALAFVTKGQFELQAIRTDSKSETLTTCSADLHVRVDQQYIDITKGQLKAEPVFGTNYTVQTTDDGKGFYVRLMSLDL